MVIGNPLTTKEHKGTQRNTKDAQRMHNGHKDLLIWNSNWHPVPNTAQL